jgi:hypothetical protein
MLTDAALQSGPCDPHWISGALGRELLFRLRDLRLQRGDVGVKAGQLGAADVNIGLQLRVELIGFARHGARHRGRHDADPRAER